MMIASYLVRLVMERIGFKLICQTWKNGWGSRKYHLVQKRQSNAFWSSHNPRGSYSLNNQNLDSNASEKDLEVRINFDSTFMQLLQPRKWIRFLRSRTFDANTISTLYKSMVRLQHLEYINAIWGLCYIGDLKLVKGVQKKLVPHLYEKPYE